MAEVGFGVRLVILVVALAAVAALDVWRRGAAATRPRSYALLLGAGALGGCFGAAFDQLSVTISPDYFLLGKGLQPVHGSLRLAATGLGFQAGFGAGIVGGGLLLWLNGDDPARGLPTARLVRYAGWPLACALLAAGPASLALSTLDPLGLEAELTGLLAPPARAAFARVWGAHTGLYGGGLLGLAIAAVRLRRARRASAPPEAAA